MAVWIAVVTPLNQRNGTHMAIDPICGMTVDETSALCADVAKRSCQRRRTRNPGQRLAAAASQGTLAVYLSSDECKETLHQRNNP